MRVGLWVEGSITPERFVYCSPNNQTPLIASLKKRGHKVTLIHLPWKTKGEFVLEDSSYEDLRPPAALDEAIARRGRIMRILKENCSYDSTMRSFVASLNTVKEQEPESLPYDVVYMKLPPAVFLKSRVEVMYNLWRFAHANVPVFCFGSDDMLDHVVDWFGLNGMTMPLLHCYTPYFPRKTIPNWSFLPFFYDAASELPVNVNARRIAHVLGYVGNDFKTSAGSPRAAKIGKFYNTPSAAIWGDWTDENKDQTGIPRSQFKGPISASEVTAKYHQCAASVVVGMPLQYKMGHVTQRYREVINSGALCLFDADYSSAVTSVYADPMYRVSSLQEAVDWATRMEYPVEQAVHLNRQREYVRDNPTLSLERWVDMLEHMANKPVAEVTMETVSQ